MIDIHCHMLPGVDDGSDSMDTSLLMASMAAESGVETVIVTPHCNIPGEAANYPSRELLGRFMALRETIDAAKIPLRILAGAEVHPERYNAVQRDRTLPERWFASGYVLQVNKDSIFGGLGQRAKRAAEFILSQGLAHIAASDAHSTYSRNPELARLHEHISLNYSEDYAQILLEENPKRIIENKPMLRA